MGADIRFMDKKDQVLFYFRDSYNLTNLAWTIGLSYWEVKEVDVDTAVSFFHRLKSITDEQLKSYLDRTEEQRTNWTVGDQRELMKVWKSKIKDIKDHWKIIEKAERVEWNV